MTRSLQARDGKRRPLLLVEDDDSVRRGLTLLLHGQGFDVRAFEDARFALADATATEAQFLVVDYMLAGVDGMTMLEALKQRGWAGIAVLITGFGSAALRAAAAKAGFSAVLDKPFRDDALLRALQH